MRHARAQTARDEREVRIGVARFDGALGRVEILASLQPVVGVPGPLREDAAQRVDVRGHARRAEAGGEAAVEEARGGVRGPVETLGK